MKISVFPGPLQPPGAVAFANLSYASENEKIPQRYWLEASLVKQKKNRVKPSRAESPANHNRAKLAQRARWKIKRVLWLIAVIGRNARGFRAVSAGLPRRYHELRI